jgi:hypothetical protein
VVCKGLLRERRKLLNRRGRRLQKMLVSNVQVVDRIDFPEGLSAVCVINGVESAIRMFDAGEIV